MNQIDKILPSKEEVDELFDELTVFPESINKIPPSIILAKDKIESRIITGVKNENM